MKLFNRSICALVFSLSLGTALISCKNSMNDNDPMDDIMGGSQGSPNILLIIADDMGLDATNGYSEGSQKPTTPNIDEIKNNGLLFSNMWVNPTCSPTRSSIITGKYGYNTGVLSAGNSLSSDHQILHSYISEQTGDAYSTAVIGKWHLSQENSFNPESLGMDYYAGLISGTANSYTSWTLTEDGTTSEETEYITKKFTDLSIDWINDQTKPWFLWLAYTAPHTPFHFPPLEMHTQGALPEDEASINANPLPYYLASIEAMDYQIGKLLEGMSPDVLENTVIIFVGDNGTPGGTAQEPYSRTMAKGSINQGGINVPMFIKGPSITRVGKDESLINGTDLFATIASIAGVDVESIHDSKNFKSLFETSNPDFREFVYSEIIDTKSNTNGWCIRNDTYKLLEFADGSQQFFNLIIDPYESDDLLQETLNAIEISAKVALENALSEIRN